MDQHLVSEVYLKQFGYKDENAQWRVSTLELSKFSIMHEKNKKWISHKSISSFTIKTNHFDFENDDDLKFVRLIEDANTYVETHIPMLYKELNDNLSISQEGEAILAHYVSNLYVRTSNFDLLLDDLINLGAYDRFLNEVLMFSDEKDRESFPKMIKNPKFNTEKNVKNISRFLFWNYFLQRLAQFEYYIVKPAYGQGWVSSDNPVILNNHVNEDSLICFETEIIFPFSKDILILFKLARSKQVSRIFENTVLKGVSVASIEINDEINKIISDNAEKYVIIPDMQGVYEF